VDKRGVGKSTGNFSTATGADFANDVEAALAYLKSRSDIDPHRIGLIGHSEGALSALMVASRNADVAFIVMLAGPGVPGLELMPEQVRLLDIAAGMAPEKATHAAAFERELLVMVEREKDLPSLRKSLHEKLAGVIPEEQIEPTIAGSVSPWFRFFISYDPAPALRKVKCPVLALNGSLDRQVSPAQNLPAIRAALQQGGNKHVEVLEMPGLNHLFQTATTGSPEEYQVIEETMSPAVLEKITHWIQNN
jgi:pimeloyl-ACP methyl ester carboxylesterase